MSNLILVFRIALWSALVSVNTKKSVEGVMSVLMVASLGPDLAWNSPLIPPTFCVEMLMGGGAVGVVDVAA